MEIEGFLADSITCADGKLHAHGAGWNTIFCRAVPVVHGRVAIGLFLSLPTDHVGEDCELELRLVDPDGEPITIGPRTNSTGTPAERIRVTIMTRSWPDQEPLPHRVYPLGFNLDGLALNKVGAYKFIVALDGNDAKTIDFAVCVRPDAQQD